MVGNKHADFPGHSRASARNRIKLKPPDERTINTRNRYERLARITGERAHRARFSISSRIRHTGLSEPLPLSRACSSRREYTKGVSILVVSQTALCNVLVDACTKGRVSSRYDSLFKTPPSVEATFRGRESQSSLVCANI